MSICPKSILNAGGEVPQREAKVARSISREVHEKVALWPGKTLNKTVSFPTGPGIWVFAEIALNNELIKNNENRISDMIFPLYSE